REELVQGAAILAAEDIHVRAAAGVGADDNVGEAVAVDVARSHVDAAAERGVKGHEIADRPGELVARRAVEDADVGTAARPGAGDDVWGAVVVHVADRHANAAREARVLGEEAEL